MVEKAGAMVGYEATIQRGSGLRFVGLLLSLTCAGPGGAEEFTFAHLSDTHVGHPGSAEALAEVLQELAAATPRPAFVVHTGNVTEFSQAAEVSLYRETAAASPFKVFSVPGSHDARWAGRGWQPFVSFLNPLHYSLDYQRFHLVGLNSVVLLRGEGHFGPAQLEWLRADLRSVPPETPLILFWHHPGDAVDDGAELLNVLAGRNVALILHGHIRRTQAGRWGPYPVSTVGQTFGETGGYNLVRVAEDRITVVHCQRGMEGEGRGGKGTEGDGGEGKGTEEVLTVPLSTVPPPWVEVVRPAAGVTVSGPFEVGAELRRGEGDWRATGRIDEQPWTALTVEGNRAQGPVDPGPLGSEQPGAHRLTVRFSDGQGQTWEASRRFYMEAGAPVRARWRVTTGDSVQTQPALADGVVYVTGTDGTLYALSADTGQPFWRFYLGPTFPSAPTVAGGTVYVGTADGRLHAIDAQQGLERWQFATAGPVFGAPAVDGAGVYVGTGEGFLHRVDAQTGSEVWRYEAGGMIEAAPRVQEGRVYVGSWNRTLHCVDAAQGKAVWTAPIGQNRYYSPAAATPLIHEGRVFVTSPDRNLYTLDAATGILLNRQDVKAYASLGQSADRLLIRALDGYLYAYQFDGVLCWKANLGWGWDTVPLPPVAVEGTLFVGSKQGSVFSLTSDGQLLWQYRLSDGLLLAPPAATTGLVVAGTMDGVITALEF